MNFNECKLIIFDCDGVLVDSEIVANRIEAEALTSKGYHLTTEECIKRFTGVNSKCLQQIILEESGLDIPLDFLAAQQESIAQSFETASYERSFASNRRSENQKMRSF